MRSCACGCGTQIEERDKQGRERRFVNGHGNRGKRLTPEEIAKRTATRLARNGGKYQAKSGWTHTKETRRRMAAAVAKRDLSGENNPFFGRKHTEETRRKLGKRGAENPQWKGGTGYLPYGPEFNRRFKRMIRERDDQTCQRCGITRAEHGRTLEVHHIDHDKMNNDPVNLATVCGSCNTWLWWHQDEPLVPLNRR